MEYILLKEIQEWKNMKLVSIVVPVYNLERYIEKTLESLQNQTYENIEVIVINDGSKDGSLEVINTFFKGKNLKHKIVTIENSGVSKARNVGLNIAGGDYVILLDGDDRLRSDAIGCLVEQAEKTGADICQTGYLEFQEDDERVTYRYSKDPNKVFLEKSEPGYRALQMKLNKDIWICTGNALYRRDLIEKNNIRYSENMGYGEDLEFINKCLFHAVTVTSVSEDLTELMVRENSASSSKFSNSYLHSLLTNRRLYNYIKASSKVTNEEKDKILILIDYDYVHIFLSVAKKIYDEHSLWQQGRANSKFKGLNLDISEINVDQILNRIKNFKTFELKVFMVSKPLYFYFCKIFKMLRR
jgi:glycosyltransferase involved in cell wall biosynthesis